MSYSNLATDPRVVRQIGWLADGGWTIDTLGFGSKPGTTVREHFELQKHNGLRRFLLFRILIHSLLPVRLRFLLLDESRVPAELRAGASYDLLFVNEIDLLPWFDKHAKNLLSAPDGRSHLDLHEYHKWERRPGTGFVSNWLFAKYHRWLVSFIGSGVFDSRSTVAGGIADLYVADFGIPRPAIVRNVASFVDQDPRAVDPARIELVYHGNAEPDRGIGLVIDALQFIESRFVLNLMLTGSPSHIAALIGQTTPMTDRVIFHDAVPMSEVARAVNRFDLELIFYPPRTPNYLFSFPNKFFEAIQGRIGVVIGESPSMQGIVREFGSGLVVDGWSASDLAAALNSLNSHQIEDMKKAADRGAKVLNTRNEGDAFYRSINVPNDQGNSPIE